MPDFLARQVQQTLDAGVVAVSIERKAGVPPTTIHNILRGRHPRPERLAALLLAVDRDTAARWLRAYLMDDVPEDWRDQVSIAVSAATEHLTDPSPSDPTDPTQSDPFLQAIDWLRSEGEHDLAVVNFVTNLVAMLRRDPQ